MAFSYNIYGYKMISDIEFIQLTRADENEIECSMFAASYNGSVVKKTNDENDEVFFVREVFKLPDRLVKSKEKSGKLYVFDTVFSFIENKTLYMWAEEGTTLYFKRKNNANEQYVRTYLLGFGLAMLMMQRGELALHCSVVMNNDRAVILCGESGCGKSTVTANLLDSGWSFMADDMAVVSVKGGEVFVRPAFPYQKLCRDAAIDKKLELDKLIYIDEAKDKFMVKYKGDFCNKPVKIGMLVMLLWNQMDNLVVDKVTGLEKMRVVAENLFLRRLLGKDKYGTVTGKKCLEISAHIPVYVMARNKTCITAEQICCEIENLCKTTKIENK